MGLPIKDATSSSDSGSSGVSSLSWSHTVTSSHGNLILLVAVATGEAATGVTYNSASLTQLSQVTTSSGEVWTVYYKLAPSTGTNTIHVSMPDSSSGIQAAAISYYNVAQTSTFGTVATNTGSTTTSSTNVTTTTSFQLVLDFMNNAAASAPTPTAGQTIESSDNDASFATWIGISDVAATGSSMTMTWSSLATSFPWAEIAVAMNGIVSTSGGTLSLMGVG